MARYGHVTRADDVHVSWSIAKYVDRACARDVHVCLARFVHVARTKDIEILVLLYFEKWIIKKNHQHCSLF